MLTLHAQNFRALHHLAWPLREMSILAGANGTGKTTALLALRVLSARLAHGGRHCADAPVCPGDVRGSVGRARDHEPPRRRGHERLHLPARTVRRETLTLRNL